MLKDKDYVRLSCELHLFFARIMKEHSFFLEAGYMNKDEEFKQIARDFQMSFGEVLHKAIQLGDGNISEEVLTSKEIVTENTLKAEIATANLAGAYFDTDITKKAMHLRSGIAENPELVVEVQCLNKQVLPMLENLIYFKESTLNKVLECGMYTVNYPLLITHMIREAKMYHYLLTRIQRKEIINDKFIYKTEMFWNKQMMEHAEFIRGLLDPTERELMIKADKIADEYEKILKNGNHLTDLSLKETNHFIEFKEAGRDGILDCKVKSIIVPILADHLLREAYHFRRILNSYKA